MFVWLLDFLRLVEVMSIELVAGLCVGNRGGGGNVEECCNGQGPVSK